MEEDKPDSRVSYREALYRGKDRIGAILGTQTPEGQVTITLPNYLTIGRLVVAPIFLYAFFAHEWWLQVSGSVLFALGALSDLWDGKIARRWGQVTAFGDFMDPLADKLLTLTAFWAILFREDFGVYESPATIYASLITLREITLTIMRVRKIQAGSSVVTSIWGKWKTGVQLTSLLFALAALNLRDYLIGERIYIPELAIEALFLSFTILFFFSAVTSIVSGWLYLKEDGGRNQAS